MAVIRVNKTKDYTVMSNTHLKDKNLSLKAKGLLSIMLSLPDGWNYKVNIPNNGILLTSSTKTFDLRETNFITQSGLKLNTEKTDLGFGEILNDKINCKGKFYEFTVWKVQKFYCGYSTDETKKIKQNLQKQICN